MDRLLKTSLLAALAMAGPVARDVAAQGPPAAFGQNGPVYQQSPSPQARPFPVYPPGAPGMPGAPGGMAPSTPAPSLPGAGGPAPIGEAGNRPGPGEAGAGTQPGAGGAANQPGAGAGEAAAPESTATPPAQPGADFSSSFSPGEGGAAGGAQSGAVMIGDQAPIFGRPRPPGPAPQPGPPPVFRGLGRLATKGGTTVPWIRGFKISDNQSPVPQDRVYFNFNYFNNMNYAVDRHLGTPVSGIQIYRYQAGFEKTFWSGWASIGLRDGINTLSARSPYQSLGGTHTAMGDLTVFSKFVFWQNWEDNNGSSAFSGFGYPAQVGGRNGGLFSGGLAVTMPTGPGSFAGSPISKSFRAVNLQPYLGYFFSRGNFFLQGFEAISVPCDPNDVTILFNDIGMGYYVYRNPAMDTLITAIAPTFETHINVPLNHRGVFNVSDPVGMADVVDLTLGTNIQFGRRTLLLLGAVTPVSGPRPFAIEATALLNVYFGGRNIPPVTPAYPMAGQ